MLRVAVLMACLMAAASVAGIVARPSAKASTAGPRFLLEDTVPKAFGGWKELPMDGGYVVNPQTKELLDKLYSQILTRTYVNESGYRIMLSLAYGDDQRGDLAAHKPRCATGAGFCAAQQCGVHRGHAVRQHRGAAGSAPAWASARSR